MRKVGTGCSVVPRCQKTSSLEVGADGFEINSWMSFCEHLILDLEITRLIQDPQGKCLGVVEKIIWKLSVWLPIFCDCIRVIPR